MVTIRRSVNDYHLRVVSHSGDPEPRCIERRVDVFLEDLYKVPGRPTTQPPLAFSECTFYGHQTVLVKSFIPVVCQIFSILSHIVDRIQAVPEWGTSLYSRQCTFRFLRKDFQARCVFYCTNIEFEFRPWVISHI